MALSHYPSKFLPTSKKEMDLLGWKQADIIIFSGDSYVDHPSFGSAVIGRILEKEGFKVAIIPQPNWRDDLRDFKKLGPPRLFFAVTSGCMDSMVNHYTANKRLRSDDAYTAGGKSGNRPDYAVKVYSQIIKNIYPDIPLIIGGVEASLRRLTHYDYWSDKLFPSILIDSGADILVYGMGERSIIEIANRIDKGLSINDIQDVPQIAHLTNQEPSYLTEKQYIKLHSYEECLNSKLKFGENFVNIEKESNSIKAKHLIEPIGNRIVVINPPYPPPSAEEMDSWWNLPYLRSPHPRYKDKVIPAWEMIKFSVNIHRGCFGGCSFCTISMHQGKFVSSRSEESILTEINQIKLLPDFKGYLSDLGGPSANMYRMKGKDLKICENCKKPSCIFPSICNNLDHNHKPLVELYKNVNRIKGIKKAFVGSGVRYDLFADFNEVTNKEYFEELVLNHVSGRLKVAPEHTEDEVLKLMRKPSFKLFNQLKERFEKLNKSNSINQQLVPYFISSHPLCTENHMQQLAQKLKQLGIKPEPVQDFTPTPMTLSSTIFYTGIDPYTGKKVYVARTRAEKTRQKEFFFTEISNDKKYSRSKSGVKQKPKL